jgi:hypothetical protein
MTFTRRNATIRDATFPGASRNGCQLGNDIFLSRRYYIGIERYCAQRFLLLSVSDVRAVLERCFHCTRAKMPFCRRSILPTSPINFLSALMASAEE